MSNQTVKAGYNKIAKTYLNDYRDLFKSNKHLDLLIDHLQKGATVLDIGCGAGVPVDKYLIDKGFKIIGIDISEKQIELAQKYLPQGEFHLKDMTEFKDGEFSVDAVVSFYAISHTPREQHLEILKKVNSFLPNNGLLLVTMGSGDWVGKESDFLGTEMEWSHYDSETNKKLIQDAGFKILFDEIDTQVGEKHLVVLGQKV